MSYHNHYNPCGSRCGGGCGCGSKCCSSSYDYHHHECCDPCKKTVGSLCVKHKLQVKDGSTLCGTTDVEKLQFKDQSVPKDGKRWCAQENANSMLAFSYNSGAKLRVTKDGQVLSSGFYADATEVKDITTGNTVVDPSVSNGSTFIRNQTNPLEDGSGTLADGLYDGQIKRVALLTSVVANAGFYSLTVTNYVHGNISNPIRLGEDSVIDCPQSVVLQWIGSLGQWTVVATDAQ